MTISLARYEREALETLEESFALDRELVVGFGLSLNRITELFEQLTQGSEREIRAGKVVVMGLINHTHLLLIGGLQSLQVGKTLPFGLPAPED